MLQAAQSHDTNDLQFPTKTPHVGWYDRIRRVETFLPIDDYLLFVREVRPAVSASNHWVLFIHGNTFPSEVDFDLPLPGYSFSEYFTTRGLNCCLFDHRGYGRSSKLENGGPLTLEAKVRDVSKVLSHLVQKRGATSIDIVALSTGCPTVVELLRTCPVSEVRSLVFLGPCYLYNPFLRLSAIRTRVIKALRGLVGQYQNDYMAMTPDQLEHRLRDGEEGSIDRYVVRTFIHLAIDATMPGATQLSSPVLAFPGTSARELWGPMFDASHIDRPLLVIRGEQDEICCERSAQELVQEVSQQHGQVRLVTIPERKHDMHLYRNHDSFFHTVLQSVC